MSETSATSRWADLANPTRFVAFADRADAVARRRCRRWCSSPASTSAFRAPEDYQQGTTVRIMYIHVPFAWLAMMCYTIMALAALGTLVWRHPLADVAAKAPPRSAPPSPRSALVTGSIWGKPMWGTWWVWDARLTSVFILFLMYLGIIALRRAIDDPARAARAAAVMTLVGFINIPIIKFSVDWWNTLHQPASVFRLDGPTIDPSLLLPLMVMALALHVAVLHAASDGDPHRDPAPPRRGDAAHRGAPRRAKGLTMSTHDMFVAAAYVLSAIGLAGLIAWIVADQETQRRELAAFEARGVKRRSERAEKATS